MIKRSVAIALFIIAGIAATGIWYSTHPPELETMQHNADPVVSSLPSAEFVKLCSGLDTVSEQSRLLATANCLGRIRGYADSHQQTIRMLQQSYNLAPTAQLWCIPKPTTDKQLLTVILTWVDANPRQYDSVISNYSGTAGAMGVLAAALHATYPCK